MIVYKLLCVVLDKASFKNLTLVLEADSVAHPLLRAPPVRQGHVTSPSQQALGGSDNSISRLKCRRTVWGTLVSTTSPMTERKAVYPKWCSSKLVETLPASVLSHCMEQSLCQPY